MLVNHPSVYTALAASAIMAYYGHGEDAALGAKLPLTGETFFDGQDFARGEYASKVAYRWRAERGQLRWDDGGEGVEDAVDVYRRALAAAEDDSVTIVSVGFFDNVCVQILG